MDLHYAVTAQNLSNVAYACGKLNHLDPALLATIARRALAQMQVGILSLQALLHESHPSPIFLLMTHRDISSGVRSSSGAWSPH